MFESLIFKRKPKNKIKLLLCHDHKKFSHNVNLVIDLNSFKKKENFHLNLKTQNSHFHLKINHDEI